VKPRRKQSNGAPPVPASAKAHHVRKLFGTDGIRGIANEHPMTPELALQLGRAVAFVAGRGKSHTPRILIGKDTRLSGYMLETAIASGVCAMGGRVILIGPMPTPAVAHLTVSMRADAGIVISASHNPYQDNGIKVFGSDGFKLPDEAESEIERLMENHALLGKRSTGPAIGRAEKLEDARGRYVVFLKQTFPRDLSLDGVRVVVDAAHGAAYRVAPLVFQELGAHVTAIGVKPNGVNINKDAGRVIVVDEKGQLVDGDAILAMCAAQMCSEGSLRKKTVVATVMSNLGLEHALVRAGVKLVRTQVGDRYVVEAMRSGGYNLGGEQSGHIVFLDHSSTGDGILGALQVLALMLRSGRPLSELGERAMQRVPQVLENVTLPERKPLADMRRLAELTAKITRALGDGGRVLVRWSGTEPKLRIMLEGPREERIRAWAKELAEAARRDLP
jgi:phosphoglucosamine mutase